MALHITSIEKGSWTAHDLFREVVAKTFDQTGGDAGTFGNAVQIMHVADSQEDYFSADNPFTTIDDLARKLVGINGSDLPAVRVCIGTSSSKYVDEDNVSLSNIGTHKLGLSVIGKATDGGPMIRLAISNDPNV